MHFNNCHLKNPAKAGSQSRPQESSGQQDLPYDLLCACSVVGRGICPRDAEGKDSFVGLAGEERLESKRKIRAMPQLPAGCPDNPRNVTSGTIMDAPNASRHLMCCSFLHTKGGTQTTQQQPEQISAGGPLWLAGQPLP